MVLAGASPVGPPLSPAKEQAAIRALRKAHNQALAAHDIDAVVHLSTDDFVMILGGGGQVIQGRPAYREFVAAAFSDPHPMLFVRLPDRIDIGAPDGRPVAAETGRWMGNATDGATFRIGGRYLVHWIKLAGEWRIASETYVMVDQAHAARTASKD